MNEKWREKENKICREASASDEKILLIDFSFVFHHAIFPLFSQLLYVDFLEKSRITRRRKVQLWLPIFHSFHPPPLTHINSLKYFSFITAIFLCTLLFINTKQHIHSHREQCLEEWNKERERSEWEDLKTEKFTFLQKWATQQNK
jgi:uncharacterized membrane protein